MKAKSIAELRSENLPRCTMADLSLNLNPQEDAESQQLALELSEDINNYLREFSKPAKRDKGTGFMFGRTNCISCGEPLTGMLGHFKWGICHGEGECSCGYPGRGIHYMKGRDGKEIFERPFEIVLQYHPEELREAVKEAALPQLKEQP